ncbi:hypothetical protein ACD591_19320 [Rufibacter glacialis]|uniref:Uncharacterized protein n=1 Tax=Rufibacter glacialis TaxID=1259555 RepID=A0A5M8Q2Y2_9BACT|nr:hypothetical protein [Rufibacter glacialis]KAA6430255.1 hypothetical protein FOE74_20795 [Rufibacter glacialis]GGK87757.1 hypothetical protein GCM10011405_39340 [Rufibacter glacialis]
MGLDWKPLNKPLAGREEEYEDIFLTLSGKKKANTSILGSLFGKKQKSEEELLEQFLDISIPAYETLTAPKVGFDEKANEWAKSQFDQRTDKNQPLQEFLQEMHGYHVVDLVTEHDGIPVYIAPHYEPHVFRAQFLQICEQILGEEMMEEAYTSQLAPGTVDFGKRLMKIAEDYASKYNLQYLKEQRIPPDSDEDTPESKVHILFSAAKWLLWWGQRGHGYEADF